LDGFFRDDEANGNPYTQINEGNYMTVFSAIFWGVPGHAKGATGCPTPKSTGTITWLEGVDFLRFYTR